MNASSEAVTAESRTAWPPQLFREQSRAAQAVALLAGPIVLGAICGWLVGASEVAYTVLTVLAILGGIAAGYEHDSLAGGAARGLFGGALFALTICEVHRLTGDVSVANTPDPIELLVPAFAVISLFLGIIGAALRRRSERQPETLDK